MTTGIQIKHSNTHQTSSKTQNTLGVRRTQTQQMNGVSYFKNRRLRNMYIEVRGMDGRRGPVVGTACCIESSQTHCSSQKDFCAQQTLTDTELMRKWTTRLCTYSLGMHWTYLPSCNFITPSDEAAASSSVITLVRDIGMPTGAFFGSYAGSSFVGQSLFQCPGMLQRLQMKCGGGFG